MERRPLQLSFVPIAALILAAAGCSESRRPGGSSTPGTSGAKDAQVATNKDAAAPNGDASVTCACDLTTFCEQGCACDPECVEGADAGFFDASPWQADATGPGQDAQAPRDAGFLGADASPPPFDGGVLSGDPFNPTSLASQFTQAYCAYVARCEPALFAYLGMTQQECAADSASTLALWSVYSQVINAGRSAFSQAGFNACVQAYQNADCTLGLAATACADLFEGNRPAGVPCSLGIECGPGLWCAANIGSCGTCEPYGQAGADCSQTICADGLDCLQTSQSGDVQCVPINVQESQTCGTVETGLCQGKLQCVGPAAGPRTCRRPATGSQTCDPNGETNPACNIYQNESCATATSRCAPVTWLSVGGACSDTAQCNKDGYCDPPNGTPNCTAYLAVGTSCNQANDLCNEDAYCYGATCAAKATSGQNCQNSNQCASDLYCVSGTCRPLTWTQCN